MVGLHEKKLAPWELVGFLYEDQFICLLMDVGSQQLVHLCSNDSYRDLDFKT